MKTILKILLITASVLAAPVPEGEEQVKLNYGEDLDEYGNYFEGDMVLNDEQETHITRSSFGLQERNGVVNESYRWPHKVLYYELSGVFDYEHEKAIAEALQTIQDKSCVRFQKLTGGYKNPDYVYVTGHPVGCYSEIGRQGGKQLLNLAPHRVGFGCFKIGSIMHEFVHALGFFHQQSAPDRDSYVEIHYENIINGHENNFDKYSTTDLTEFNIEYDYNSLMHYSQDAFSKNGKATMTTIYDAKIGQRSHLSYGDISKLNIMYECW